MALAREESVVLLEPPLELVSPPAGGKMIAEQGQRGFQLGSAQEPRVVVATLMAIRSVDASSELIGEVAQREWVTRMELDLEIWLLPVGGERALSHHQPHNVPKLECVHELNLSHVRHWNRGTWHPSQAREL